MKRILWIALIWMLCVFPVAIQAATSITTRSGVGRSLTWSEMDTNFSNLRNATDGYAASLSSSIAAIQAAQTAGAIGYQTVAAMNADLAHAAGTLATVTNDPTASNNTYWIKLGASGSGSWQKSAISPFLPYYSSRQFTTVAQAITAIGSSTPSVLRVSTTLTVTNGDTVPANISIIVENGGLFQGSGTETIAFNGPFSAGNHLVFSNCGAITGTGIKESRPEWFAQNTTPGTTDMTAAIQYAANAVTSGTIILSDTIYKISNTITFGPNHRFVGNTRANTCITMSDNTKYAFTYITDLNTTALEITASILFENMTINAKYGININQSGDFTTVFNKQGFVMVPQFKNVIFNGIYSSISDTGKNTNAYPTFSELQGYGVALSLSKSFKSTIRDCKFINNGIGIYADGADLSRFENSRFMNNGRHIHLYGHDTFGGQIEIVHNEFLNNIRRGGIYDSNVATSIFDNYFETYSAASEHITNRGGSIGAYSFNRFDNYAGSTPMMSLAPSYGLIVSGNRLNPNGTPQTVEVLNTNYIVTAGVGNNFFVKFLGNSGTWPTGKSPWCEYDWNNPRVFDAYNPKTLTGTPTASFPFMTSGTSGRPVLTTTIGDFIVALETRPTDSTITLKASGTYLTAGGYAIVTWGGTVAWSGYFGFTNISGVQVRSVTVNKPAGVAPDSGLSIELVNTQVEYQALEII